MLDKHISNKIKIVSFWYTIMVVFRHSLNIQAFWGIPTVDNHVMFIETSVSKLTEIAVPSFFLISGLFFFGKIYHSPKEYGKMLQKKVKTLFIPFLVWNIWGALILLCSHQFTPYQAIYDYLIALLHSDWNGPLWYVRDLMTLMLISPLYAWIFSSKRSYWFLVVICFILFYYWIPVMSNWIAVESMLFFFLGGCISRHKVILTYHLPWYFTFILLVIWIISSSFYPYYWPIHRYNIILGIFVFWVMIDYMPTILKQLSIKLARYAFFIYVTHIYIIKALKVSIAHLFPANEYIALLTYFSLPIITVVSMSYLGKLWLKYHPKSYLFLTGDRN